MNQILYANINTLCKNKHISIRKLESELGFSNGMIQGWKHNNPRLESLIAVCRFFHVSIDSVLGFNPIEGD